MNLKFIILIGTIFLTVNAYYDNEYVELLKSWKKYYIMGGYLFVGGSILYYINKYPSDGYNLVKHGTGLLQAMPLDKNSRDIITPLLSSTMPQATPAKINVQERTYFDTGQKSHSGSTKRSVSETKKKFVASQQGWLCAHCGCQLPAWYEVDHITRLQHGGSNEIDNLEALCRDCHGKKTTIENL